MELQGPHGWQCHRIDASYERTDDGKSFVATLQFETPPGETASFKLVLTKAPRPVTVEFPFLVRNVEAQVTAPP
jgi:hypothetical protein